MKVEIDSIVDSLSRNPKNTGLVVGVISREHRSVFGYGQGSGSSPEPPSGNTMFEIGSITKVLTTSLLAILTEDGLLNLNDPVRELMPSLFNLPPQITLLRLASHTAGLPKMPSNLIPSMLKNRGNPYASYTTDDLYRYLSRYRPRRHLESVDQINYSNLGVALLGHVLAQSIDTSYEQAIVSRICDKLGMHDTRITLTPERKERLTIPHTANGKPIQNWDLGAFAGAGALRSTANDMLKFLAANLGGSQSSLTDALQLCHEIRSEAFPRQGPLQRLFSAQFQRGRDTENRRQAVALGWFEGELGRVRKRVYWHHGATGGYRSFIGFVKSTETGVIVLANRGPSRLDLISSRTSADEIGFRVLEYLNSADQ